MFLVGLTGGIGSGKSTVASAFADRGWPVIDADAVAREIVEPGEETLDALADRFGAHIIRADGSLDRAALAKVAFADDRSRADLDRLTHPRITARIAERLAALAADPPADRPLIVVLDHPLLIETSQVRRFDAVVVVLADAQVRLDRLVEQRGLDADDVRNRMRAQASDEARRAAATHLLVNEGTRDELEAAVAEVGDRIETEATDAWRATRP